MCFAARPMSAPASSLQVQRRGKKVAPPNKIRDAGTNPICEGEPPEVCYNACNDQHLRNLCISNTPMSSGESVLRGGIDETAVTHGWGRLHVVGNSYARPGGCILHIFLKTRCTVERNANTNSSQRVMGPVRALKQLPVIYLKFSLNIFTFEGKHSSDALKIPVAPSFVGVPSNYRSQRRFVLSL